MKDFIYLDNGATSFPKPEEVYINMDQYYRRLGVNPGRSGYDICVEAGEVVEDTRKVLTQLFNGRDPNRLCFSYNATDALNLIISGILQKGDHAITTTVEHNSVLRPLYHFSEFGGGEVDHIRFDSKGFVDPDDVKKSFKSNTKLVIINHASNVIGTIQPIKEIGRLCKEKGIIFAIDASQSAGKIPVDMEEHNLDIITFTGNKSLLGPTGIGGLYVREGIEIRHTRAGGTGVRSAVKTHLNEYPYRLEYGTPNTLGISGLLAGCQWIERQGMEYLHQQETKLTTRLRDGLQKIDGVTLYCQDDLNNHISILLFNIDGLEAMNTGTLLDVDHNIACRTGLHCAPLVHDQLGTTEIHGAVRFGIGPFNTEEHIEAAIEGVEDIAEMQKKRSE